MSDRPMKAYTVLEECEGTGYIYFARHAVTARREGANELADGDFSYVTCHRAQWADRYAETGIVPARELVAYGWRFECTGCGETIDEDWLRDTYKPLSRVIGFQRSAIYCSPKCYRHDLRMSHRRKEEERKAIGEFRSIVRRRFPDADFCDELPVTGHHAYVVPHSGVWHRAQVVIAFRFPGMKIGPAHYRYDPGNSRAKIGPHRAYYTCCGGDREAFEAWAKTYPPRHPGLEPGSSVQGTER